MMPGSNPFNSGTRRTHPAAKRSHRSGRQHDPARSGRTLTKPAVSPRRKRKRLVLHPERGSGPGPGSGRHDSSMRDPQYRENMSAAGRDQACGSGGPLGVGMPGPRGRDLGDGARGIHRQPGRGARRIPVPRVTAGPGIVARNTATAGPADAAKRIEELQRRTGRGRLLAGRRDAAAEMIGDGAAGTR